LGLLWLVAWHFAFRSVPETASVHENIVRVSFRSLLMRPAVRRQLIARFCFDPVFYFYMFWIPQYFSRERGLSLVEIGSLTWIPFLVLGLTSIGVGRVSDMLVGRGWVPQRARLILMLIAALITPASWLASLAGTPVVAIALMSVLMFAHGIWITNYITLIADTVKPEEVGTTLGLSGTCGGIGGMISSLLIGVVVDNYSFGPVFMASAVLYPIAWIVLRTGGDGTYAKCRSSSRQKVNSMKTDQ